MADLTQVPTGSGRSLPLAQVAEHARRVGDLCDLLEAIADDLPRKTKPIWREVIRLCSTIIPNHYDDVIGVVVPVLMRRTEGDIDCESVLRRLHADYIDGRVRLPELTDILDDAIRSDGPAIEPEALGFALRSFFQAIRRQTDWEIDVLLPLANRRLTREDLDEIALSLSVHGIDELPKIPNVSSVGNA